MDISLCMKVLFIEVCLPTVTCTWSASRYLNTILDAKGWIPKDLPVLRTHPINKKLREYVSIGLKGALEECQYQFKWDKWNCPNSAFSAIFAAPNETATREDAFVRAIASAGVMYMLTRQACFAGEFPLCGCEYVWGLQRGDDPDNRWKVKENWDWGGCSENVIFANKVTKHVFRALESYGDKRSAVHKHNFDVGRKIIRRQMDVHCRCHGPSYGCSLMTCWQKPKVFRKSGEQIKRLYKFAKLIENNLKLSGNQIEETHRQLTSTTPSKDLFYMDASPNYCARPNVSKSERTVYRECSRPGNKTVSDSERQSCDNVCTECGLPVKEKTLEYSVDCNCTFQWCCKVSCEKCKKLKTTYYCEA